MIRWWRRVQRTVVDAFAVRSRQVLLFAALAGVVTGLGVALFETIVVEWLLDNFLDLPLWALALMPTAGLVIAAVSLRALGPASPGTTDAYLQAFHDPEAAADRAPGRGPDAGRDRHARVRRRDGPGGTVVVPRRVDRRLAPVAVPSLLPVGGPSGPDGRRCCGRGRGDLQGTGDRRGVRARSAVPGRLRPQDAAPRARRRGRRLPRLRRRARHAEPHPARRRFARALGRRPRRRGRARHRRWSGRPVLRRAHPPGQGREHERGRVGADRRGRRHDGRRAPARARGRAPLDHDRRRLPDDRVGARAEPRGRGSS